MAHYKPSKRRCILFGPTRSPTPNIKCSGSVVMFHNFLVNNNSQPLCEPHARHYYGNESIDRLIHLGLIKWKLKVSNDANQQELALGEAKGE